MQSIRSPRKPSNLDGAKIAAGKTLFVSDGSCNGCHGGDKWTISTRFYAPALDTTNALSTTSWAAPAGFPAALLPAADQRFMRFANGNAGGARSDPVHPPPGRRPSARPTRVMGQVVERRQDMTTPAQGDQANGNGYNPPSLLGIQIGAPYLHAGNAATLESLFSPTFKEHYGTLAPNFLQETDPAERAAKVEQLVQFLLSIDADAPTTTIPAAGAQEETSAAVTCSPDAPSRRSPALLRHGERATGASGGRGTGDSVNGADRQRSDAGSWGAQGSSACRRPVRGSRSTGLPAA